MATNLSIENLSPLLERADIGSKLNPGGSSSTTKVLQEMEQNGLSTNDVKGTFAEMLTESVSKVNQYQKESDHAIQELVAGRSKNIHETMLAIERADMSMKMLMQVRNKVLDAYREIIRMQV